MPKKRLLTLLVSTLLSLCFLSLFLAWRYVLPVNPQDSYFLPKEISMGELGWFFRRIKPVYLYSYEKDDGLYMKAIIRGNKNRVRIIDVFLGGAVNNKKVMLASFTTGDKQISGKYVGEYEYPIKFGERVVVTYLSYVTRAEYPKDREEFCKVNEFSRDACDRASYLEEQDETFVNFFNGGILPKNKFLLSIDIEKVD